MTLTRDQLLARKLGRETVELAPGEEVVVRGMTRGEAAGMRALDQDDVIGLEAYALSICLVEPKLTVEEARQWLDQEGADYVQRVIDAAQRLGGQAQGQAKGYTKRVPRKR